MSEDIYIDVNYLTESERDIILQVLAKDEELRKQEKRRISKLKNELDEIKKRGASEDEINSSRLCARCRVPLGFVINSGALCPKCEARVCKECRKVDNSSWLCVLCAKIRDVRAESGAWFFEQERRKGDRPQLYGSALVRASFRRAKPSSQHKKEVRYFEPGSPPVIMQASPSDGSRLHRPVPVHMSRLAEKEEVEEKENTEINQNYKQYVKANRVPRKVEEVQSDECEKPSSSSHSTTPRGSPVHDLENDAVEEPEETVFEHLVDKDDSGTEIEDEMDEQVNEHDVSHRNHHIHEHDAVNGGYSEEEVQNYEEKVNSWEVDQEESIHDRGRVNSETSVEIKSSWHEVAHEWAESGSNYDQSPAQDTHAQKQFLNARPASPDSETTGEFFTPLATPLHSGTGTPALSEHGQSEEGMASGSEIFVDAGDTTPIEGDRTPVAEMSEEDDEANVGDVTIFNPEITCSTEPDDAAGVEGGHRTPTRDEDTDSIDQAFANYEREHPNVGTKTLQEQLNIISMGSRESIVSYYSDAGEGRFGNITVTGEILFGLRFDRHKDQLEVQIHRAKDIAPADEKKKRSDPYVKVYLLPDKTRGGKRKTKVKRNTLEPDFDEILRFKLGFDEMLTRTLWLTMWNHDTFGHNDFLGEVMLPLDTYQDSGFSWDDPSPNWYPLRERRSEPSLMTYCGDLTVGLMFEPGTENHKDKKKKKKLGGKLHIQLKGARNLSAKDSNGFSDPFVKSYLLPDTSKKTKHKTGVVKRNLNPVWDHSFSYDNQTLDELRNRVLELTVWDYDRGSSNDFLGGLRLGLGNKTESWDDSQGLEVQAWEMMLDRPNKWHEYTLNLRSSMDSQVD